MAKTPEEEKVLKSYSEQLKRVQQNLESELEQRKDRVLEIISRNENVRQYQESSIKQRGIKESINEERERIKNKGLNQDIDLKKMTLKVLFIFLGAETLLIFAFTFLQATHFLWFKLEEWSFKLLVFATITQITFMVNIAVKHLFPSKK